jgi:hypothetical protein
MNAQNFPWIGDSQIDLVYDFLQTWMSQVHWRDWFKLMLAFLNVITKWGVLSPSPVTAPEMPG